MNNNSLFTEQNRYPDKLYCQGIYPQMVSETEGFIQKDGSGKQSVVLPLRAYTVYVVRFPNKTDRVRAAVVAEDPRLLPDGGSIAYTRNPKLPYFDAEPGEDCDFMYVSNRENEYLVVCTGNSEPVPIYIGESPILLGRDTDDEWYHAPLAGDLNGNEDSWGNWQWSSEQLFQKIYEPLRAQYPGYISRQWIGMDQSNTYDMWAYTFTPSGYEQVLFITGGLHGAEMDGYLGLARFMELLCQENGSNKGLHYLRTKVKIVLVPLVNVWSASTSHIRQNSTGIDLNRDYQAHSQAETVNVLWLLHQYKNEVGAVIDYHTSHSDTLDLYYQFSIQAPNAPMCLKVTNHIYEDLKLRGLANPPDVHMIPGAFHKSDVFLQGYVWNHFQIPTLVVEHEHLRYFPMHSAENLQLAAEYYGNFMIQTALCKLKLLK